ncbi:tetratricopeptide repeat protein, partial [Streptomyces sp. NPDC059496]|uniref:tetratricopeptide repeat protein n=1 Tax=Streptomyces sp. NPDC059496 TaxID=3346851 RepID=UPI0036CBCAA9
GAVDAYATLLEDCLRVLGPDHPDTLRARHNLASWQGEAGDPAGAADAYATLLEDGVRVLGPDHPHTVATRSNLAYWQGEAGDQDGAASAYTRPLEGSFLMFGPATHAMLAAIARHNREERRGEHGDARS